MANQNANNVSITGGDASGITGTANQFTNETLFGPVNYGSTGAGGGGFDVFAVYPMPALAIDVTQMFNTVTLTGSDTGHPNEALTFSGVPAYAVQQFGVLIYNSDAVAHHPTVPSSWSFNGGSTTTTFWIQPSSYVYITWKYTGTLYLLNGDPRTLDDLGSGTPVAADEVMYYSVGQSGGGVTNKTTWSAIPFQHSITFVLNGNGAAIPSGTQVAYTLAGYAGTITKWKMTASPASTSITLDVFRIANASPGGNTLPTASIVGSGTKPALSSAVETYGTPSDWVAGSGSVTIAENDMMTVSASGTPTSQYATLTLYTQ